MIRKIPYLLISFCVCFSAFAKLEDLFVNETSIEKPFELRDPFKAPLFKSEAKKKREKEFSGNFERNIERLEGEVPLDQVKIVGVLIGKDRRVMIEQGGKVFTLKEGQNLGNNGPEIKAILAGGIVLVEQIVNIYDETEYIETVIPISR